MPFASIPGSPLYYECEGKGEPLVLISGYSCDNTFWDKLYTPLTTQFQVLRFDNRGIGQSKDPGLPFALENLAEDTMHLIRAVGLKNPIIVGQSMGGAIAQIVAKQYPSEISKLIIINSAAKISQRTLFALETLLKLLKKVVDEDDIDNLIETSMPWFFSSNFLAHPENIRAYKTLLKNNPFPPSADILKRQLKALYTFDASQWLHELTMPILVVVSDDDIICLPKESEHLKNAIKGEGLLGKQVELIHIAGGHSSVLENPLKVENAIIRFCL